MMRGCKAAIMSHHTVIKPDNDGDNGYDEMMVTDMMMILTLALTVLTWVLTVLTLILGLLLRKESGNGS